MKYTPFIRHRTFIGTASLAVVLAFIFAGTSASIARAHILRSDKAMTAELHMPPNDAPIAGDPATLQFTFDETIGDFALANCDCTVSYSNGNKTVGKQALVATSPTVSKNTFTFPAPATYTIRVNGAPKNGAEFEAFTLEYSKRVGGVAKNESSPVLIVAIAAGVGLIFIYALVTSILRSRRKKANHEDA